MKQALSIKYAGELVGADSLGVDYQAFSNLGLVCPICKDSVFLVAAHTCNRKGKVFPVCSHFSHHKGKSTSEIAACENRITSMSSKDIGKIKAQAKNQRRSIFQKHIWKILNTCVVTGSLNVYPQELDLLAKEGGFTRWLETGIQAHTHAIRTLFVKDGSIFTRHIEEISSTSILEWANQKFKLDDNEDTNDIANVVDIAGTRLTQEESTQRSQALIRFIQALNEELHLATIQEAASYLMQPMQTPLLETLIKHGMYSCLAIFTYDSEEYKQHPENARNIIMEGARDMLTNPEISGASQAKNIAEMNNDARALVQLNYFITDNLFNILLFTPWAKAFERYSKTK